MTAAPPTPPLSDYPRSPDYRATSTFPIPQRAGLVAFRGVARSTRRIFHELGLRAYYTREVIRALPDARTYLPHTIRQMKAIGADSVPLTALVAAFLGAVSAYQTVYQLFPGVPLSTVGLIVRQGIILEFGPLLTALVLTGRVGGKMTAEIGTMRVTEQIDALETLAYDPMAYLVIPRILAALVMLPVLTIVANAVGLASGFGMAVLATDVTIADFTAGLKLTFIPFQVVYGLIKAFLFGGAIALSCSYEGYVTEAGAEGVGNSTARAVVFTSVVILFLDVITALYLAPLIQA